MCSSSDEEKLSTILRILDEDGGGIYVGVNTVVNHFKPMRRHQHFEFSVQRDNIDSGSSHMYYYLAYYCTYYYAYYYAYTYTYIRL